MKITVAYALPEQQTHEDMEVPDGTTVQEALRLTVGPAFDADTLSPTLQAALAASIGIDDFAELRARLEQTLAWSHGIYVEIVDAPAPPGGTEPDKGVLPFAKGA